jgi:hypothetical protein
MCGTGPAQSRPADETSVAGQKGRDEAGRSREGRCESSQPARRRPIPFPRKRAARAMAIDSDFKHIAAVALVN